MRSGRRRTRRLARHRQHLAGLPLRRRQERRRSATEDEPTGWSWPRTRARRIDRRVPAAAQLLLGARDRDQSWLQLVPQGQRRDVLLWRSTGGTRGRIREPGELRSLQRAARHAAAHDGVPLSERGFGGGHLRAGVGVHAWRSLQAAARLPGDEPSLSHGPRPSTSATPAASTPTFPTSSPSRRSASTSSARSTRSDSASKTRRLALCTRAVNRCRPPRRPQQSPAHHPRMRVPASTNCRFGSIPSKARSGIRTRTFSCCLRRSTTAAHSVVTPTSCFRIPSTGRRAATPGQALTETRPKYGTVYHVGGADDLMEMARRENMLITMPHPRTKGSTGFPDSVRHLPFFADAHYQGVGFRWGMGLDRSEQRLCEYRCLPLLDDMSNWLVDTVTPLKYLLSISEVRHQQPGDDIYASSPVSYVRLNALPAAGRCQPAHRDADARRLLRHVGRGADSELRVKGRGADTDDRGRRRVDVSAELRRGGVGQRQHDRSADHLGDRPRRGRIAITSRFRSTRTGRSGCASPPGT